MFCPRERAPIQTDEREKTLRGERGEWMPLTLATVSRRQNLPRYPSLSLIVVLHFESGGPGSRGERRGSPAPGEEREVCQASDE